jgi:hypothetical protein
MNWYAAHIAMVFRLKEGRQTRFPVWENIVLIKAESAEEAFAKAEQRGREEADADDTLRWGGKPAVMEFAGVRKLTLCQDPDKRPGDGTEVTYLELEIRSEKALEKFLAREPASVMIADQFPEEPAEEQEVATEASEIPLKKAK